MKPSSSGGALRAAILSCAGLSAVHTAQATTWTGATDGNWATTTNWVGDALPGTGDTVVFDSNSAANLAINLGANREVRGLSVANPAGPVTLSNNGLTLRDAGIAMGAATQDLTVNSTITLFSAPHAFDVAPGRTLTLAAVPIRNGGANNDNVGGHVRVSTTGITKIGTIARAAILDGGNNPFVLFGDSAWAGADATGTVIAATHTPWNASVGAAFAAGPADVTGSFSQTGNGGFEGIRFADATTAHIVTLTGSTTFTGRGVLMAPGCVGGTITGGNLRPNRASTAGATMSIIQNSTAGDLVIGSFLGNASSGAPVSIAKSGPGKLIITGGGGHSGRLFIHAGTVQFGDGGITGAPGAPASIINNGALVFNRSDTLGVITNIFGTGSFTQNGTGEIALTTSVSGFTGPVNVNAGTLSASTLANLGAGTMINLSNATFKFTGVFDPSVRTINVSGDGATFDTGGNAIVFANPVASGSTGSIAKTGAGSLTLATANTYTGGTVVSGGSLIASNPAGSATGTGNVIVDTGASLGGAGSVAGAVNIASGGKLTPGAGVGTLTVGSLDLDVGSTLDLEFNGTLSNDLVTVSTIGGLTIDGGVISLLQEGTPNPFATVGTYNLFAYSGSIGGAGPTSMSVANPQPGFLYTFSASGGFVKLTIQTSGVVREWVTNGGGSWGNSVNWDGTVPNSVGAIANFHVGLGAPATVTLDGNKTVGAMTFLSAANGYTIAPGSGGSLILNNGASNSSLLDGAGVHTISAPVTLSTNTVIDTAALADSMTVSGAVNGGGTLTKTGPGSLALLGSNSFTGDITLSAGSTTFASGGLGAGDLTVTESTLVWAPANSQDISNRTITFGEGTATFDTNGNDVLLANAIGDFAAASFVKTGLGKLTLAGDNTFTETVTIANGSLQFGNGGETGSVIGNIVNNSELIANRSNLLSMPNVISGTGSLVHAGSGNLELVSTNTFTGPTTITNPAGILTVYNGTALQNSTLVYDSAGGTLAFDSNSAVTLGALEGSKNLDLTNAMPGPVTLTVGGNGAATTYSGILSGDGSLTKIGAGTMILTSPQAYTGATLATGGALELEATASINGTTLTVGNNGRFSVFGGTVTISGIANLTNAGSTTATFGLHGGTANFNGGVNAHGNANNGYLFNITAGTMTASSMSMGRSSLNFGTEPAAGSNLQGLYVNGGTVNIAGNLDMATHANASSSVSTRIDLGSLTVGGPVTVGLNNGGRWSVLHVNGGTFTSTDTVSGLLLGAATAGNAVMHVHAGTATAERVQFGQGILTGTSVLHIGGGEMFVGSGGLVKGSTDPGFVATVRLDGGVLGAKAAWSSDLPVTTDDIFTLHAADASSAPHDITLSGALTGTGALVKSGEGTVSLTGTYAYTGATFVDDGTLSLSTASLSDAATIEMATGAVLNLPHGQEDTVADFVIDGVPQGTGVYSNATHPALITGTGSLRVLPSDPFPAWIDSFTSITLPADKEKTADPDRDGLTNLEEFAFNGDPANGAETGKVRARIETVSGNQALVLTLAVRDGGSFDNLPGPAADATVAKVVYTVRGSNDLSAFDQAVSEIAASTGDMPTLDTGWTYHSFRLSGNIGGGTPRGPRGFLDVQIAEEAP